MRVLIILKYIPTADSDRKSDLLFSVIRAHELEGHSVILFTSGRKAQCDYKVLKKSFTFPQKICNFIFQKINLKLKFKYLKPSVIPSVIREHRYQKIDIILAICTANHPALHAQKIKNKTGIPYIVQEHKNYERTKFSLENLDSGYLKALRDANAVVAVSPLLADFMIKIGIRDDIGVIPNAISDGFFHPPDEKKQDTFTVVKNWGKKNFIFAGWTRWREFKRIDLLLQSFLEFNRMFPNSKLLIAGSIEPEANKRWAESFIIDNALSDAVWLFGNADRDQIHQIAHSIDCCVVPSDYETFGLPALESIAAGKPVITTNCKGPEYIVNSNELGIVIERGNTTALTNAMVYIFKNKNYFIMETIKNNAFKRFSIKSVGKEFTKLYRDVIYDSK